MEVLVDPQSLLFRSTLKSSNPILWGYLKVLKVYYMEIPLVPQVVLYRSTLGS